MKLYAVRDKSTGKLVNNITNPRHKFWEKRGSVETAIILFNPHYHNPRLGEPPRKENLEVVTYELIEEAQSHVE